MLIYAEVPTYSGRRVLYSGHAAKFFLRAITFDPDALERRFKIFKKWPGMENTAAKKTAEFSVFLQVINT